MRGFEGLLMDLLSGKERDVKLYACMALITSVCLLPAPASCSAPGPPSGSSLILAAADEPGIRLSISGTVVDQKGQPVAGASLHVYQTDASGRYTPERAMDESNARLSGRLRTDDKGRFGLRTIHPGGYPKPVKLGDRERKIPAHIHIDITAAGHAERRVQVVFADDPLLLDPYWRDWVQSLHQPVIEVDPATGAASLVIDLDPPAGH
jgi:protocatechuate 3,4-dioxygenase beta subunit